MIVKQETALSSFLLTHGLATSNDPVRVSTTAGRQHLCALFKAMGYTHGAEIGVWAGQFSEQICVANPGVQLICVDPWKAYDDYGDPKNDQARLSAARKEAMKRLEPYGCDLRRLTSTEAADGVPNGSLDFVYLDSNHAKPYVLADLEAWVPKVRSGGIVSGHDYEPVKRHAHLEVKEAVSEFTAIHKIAPVYVLANGKPPSFFWEVA